MNKTTISLVASAFAILALTGCQPVAVEKKFPDVPEQLMAAPEPLVELPADTTEPVAVLRNLNQNVDRFIKIEIQVQAWQEWYRTQKKIYEDN